MTIETFESKRHVVRARVRTPVGSETRTKQSMAEACDVNAIMKRYLSTGVLEHEEGREAFYGDFSNVDEYHGAMEKVRAAQARFDALPAAVRDHCRNDPGELLRLALDPDRIDEMVELGLIAPPPKPRPEADPEPVQGDSGTPESGGETP